jgi:hypothetical protein
MPKRVDTVEPLLRRTPVITILPLVRYYFSTELFCHTTPDINDIVSNPQYIV